MTVCDLLSPFVRCQQMKEEKEAILAEVAAAKELSEAVSAEAKLAKEKSDAELAATIALKEKVEAEMSAFQVKVLKEQVKTALSCALLAAPAV